MWATAFANTIGLAPFAEPALAGSGNFAFGGARTGTDSLNLSPSLIAQGGLFLQSRGGITPQDALYVLQSAGNEALAEIASGADPGTVTETAATDYVQVTAALVDQLQAVGAERIVVWNVPNIGLAPAITNQGLQASSLGTQIAAAMNNALADRLADENGITIFDDFSLVTNAVIDPAAVDLMNATDARGAVLACDPSVYLFWDGLHSIPAGHALLAQQMVQTIPEPATYALLIAGLLVISMQIRRHS